MLFLTFLRRQGNKGPGCFKQVPLPHYIPSTFYSYFENYSYKGELGRDQVSQGYLGTVQHRQQTRDKGYWKDIIFYIDRPPDHSWPTPALRFLTLERNKHLDTQAAVSRQGFSILCILTDTGQESGVVGERRWHRSGGWWSFLGGHLAFMLEHRDFKVT